METAREPIYFRTQVQHDRGKRVKQLKRKSGVFLAQPSDGLSVQALDLPSFSRGG